MSQLDTNENKMGVLPIPKLLLQMSLPMMLSMLVQALYNVVDSIFVARINENALTAVSLVFPVQNLMIAIAVGTGVGVNAVLSRSLGEKDFHTANESAKNGIFLALISSIIFALIGNLAATFFFHIQTDDAQIRQYGISYMTIISTMCIAVYMQVMMERLLQSTGRTFYTMISQGTGAIINIILDPILIFGLFGMPRLGVSGAAIATVISQILSCLFAMTFLLGKKVPVKITFGQYNLKVIRKILSLGFSPFLILATDSLILIFMNTVLQKYGGASQGDMLITCATIAQSYLLLITSPMIGISGGTQAILSYNYGARCVNRVKDAERNILGVMLIFTTIMFLLSRFIPRYFVLLFTTDPQYIRFSVWVIRTYTLMIIPLSFQYVFVDGLTALECPKTGLALSVTRKSLFVISAAVLPSFFGAKAAFFAEPVADGISSVLSTIVFLLLINRHLDKRCRMDKKESL